MWNSLRLWTSLAWSDVLNELSVQPSPTVTAFSGGVWVITGLILIWSILRKKAWAAKLLLGASAGYSVWYWAERLVWQNPHPNWLFAVIVNLALLVFILFNIKSMSREAYEQKFENPTID
jgi:hypothetical protein